MKYFIFLTDQPLLTRSYQKLIDVEVSSGNLTIDSLQVNTGKCLNDLNMKHWIVCLIFPKYQLGLRFFFSTNFTNQSSHGCPKISGRVLVNQDSSIFTGGNLVFQNITAVFKSSLFIENGDLQIDNCSSLEIISGRDNSC